MTNTPTDPIEDNGVANNYAEAFYGLWTPEAFTRDNGEFAKEHGLFIVSTKHFNKAINALLDSEVTKARINHLSDLSRAVGILNGLGYPDNYLTERLTQLRRKDEA